MPIGKVLIANRGEIALRILRSCRELGISTVAVYSTVDRSALHVQLADEAVCVGEGPSNKSYLNIPNILAAATSRGVDAIHPGYGFLAENDRFAEMCRDHGITFIGPSPHAIRSMGDKSTAKSTMQAVGVPTVPGSEGLLPNPEAAAELAAVMGYPVMIKATAGGGGRGMRLVPSPDQLVKLYKAAQGEADAAFGNPGLYMEKFIDRPRHVEVQILADRHGNVVHLGERDCSIQRRHQKLLEEAPSPALDPELRRQMGEAAVAAARSINYEGAGTVEFLLDRSGGFYFMEMNTRIQVEHPVTEMVTGIDLIAEQLRIAGGEPISVRQEDIQMNGHAIECRINAEDAQHNFRPAPGRITGWLPPGGPGVRVDSHVYTGYDIPPFYDSLIGKLIIWAPNRPAALARMKRALNECAITGIPTTVDFHLRMLDRPEFQRGDVHTKFVEEEML
ncbi:MAG: acetyl-CoA carboxylase biotin carboxylase subunit [Synechococcus sp.]|jgi:acetyl-CoA carboxylase biotin carboxylase subunit|uniref:acetyl-CoA carboxylase biotin carboxylase subunit n=1 Tax=Synechococcus sp. PROS-9-1 TaxID=1968775 RepID=UPI000B651536|nr:MULTISPECIES: acetyl-CoA carboxylase biotin carboxylase subunit [unclassified Synechococcus]MBC8169788.1 acetyl-CoA carboxylase biotin carboxylase subunit [Synechococcus sp.]MBL6887749.1 acetyl-CoA carboxylase biotin carboxylase subunit [Synechococcus sp. BS30m-G30]RCL59083.1 MAG: acetyl-CoA carboxylase biotin carboxylase subunit [Synechococcus sp. MED-G68]RPF73318.1 MAG: acetyl-CoA carboxylase biotin carboxylase subunit [Synechococcus sp. TMED66]MDA9639391.1 acetyl-CoA carboxylase biotin c|tara:strand:- start:394 stop:1737 length:1344 start_codon:yes stop_codon:yes gene_type:complete